MPNDNIPKEQEKANGEVLREPGATERREDDEKREISIKVVFTPVQPNKYESVIIAKELEIEGREEHQLKQSLGIC